VTRRARNVASFRKRQANGASNQVQTMIPVLCLEPLSGKRMPVSGHSNGTRSDRACV
jgi:hypothetical protein